MTAIAAMFLSVWLSLTPIPDQILQLQFAINEYRYEHGLPTLVITPHLMAAVNLRAEEMRRTCEFAHDDVEARIWGVGYPVGGWGEVLAADVPIPEDALRAWLESPRHKEILDDPRYHGIGLAVVSYDPSCYYSNVWVVDVGDTDER